MKIFLDTAHSQDIAYWAQTGIIDGITTNPTLLSRENAHPTEQIRSICSLLPNGIISVEIVETDPQRVYSQAQKIAALSDNIAVKIPCHKDYYPVIQRLINDGITLNITLVFSLTQGLMMAKLGAHYISPFIGRLEDSGGNGQELLQQLRHMIDWYGFKTRILAASIRTTEHLEAAIISGADCATVPVTVLEHAVNNPLTNKGMDIFLADWKKLSINSFP